MAMRGRPEWVGTGEGEPGVNDFLREDKRAAGEGFETLHVSASAQDHVAAYLEYHRVVGDADGGTPFTEAEYASFREKAVRERASRLYVSWRCISSGVDCKQVGPSARCFCGHRFKGHTTDNVGGKQAHKKDVHCADRDCKCKLFDYLPSHGTWEIKCVCKHGAEDHWPNSKKCRAPGCGCKRFYSAHSCACGRPWEDHETVIETREEREAAGRPVNNLLGGGAGYEALGGLTSFSSLADGHERVDRPLPLTEHRGRMQLREAEYPVAASWSRDRPEWSEDIAGAGGAGGAGEGRGRTHH